MGNSFFFSRALAYVRRLFGLAANVLQLPVVRFETDVYRKATNKDRMFVGICNAK